MLRIGSTIVQRSMHFFRPTMLLDRNKGLQRSVLNDVQYLLYRMAGGQHLVQYYQIRIDIRFRRQRTTDICKFGFEASIVFPAVREIHT